MGNVAGEQGLAPLRTNHITRITSDFKVDLIIKEISVSVQNSLTGSVVELRKKADFLTVLSFIFSRL